jgi:hypothetical protein
VVVAKQDQEVVVCVKSGLKVAVAMMLVHVKCDCHVKAAAFRLGGGELNFYSLYAYRYHLHTIEHTRTMLACKIWYGDMETHTYRGYWIKAMDEIPGQGGHPHVFLEHLATISHCSSSMDQHLWKVK